MTRWLRPLVDVVGTIALALVMLGLFFGVVLEAFRVLVNFMDVGLAIWVILLIVFSIRGTLTAGRAYLLLTIGAVVNLLVVITVGLVQTGGWAGELVLFAVEAGLACLVAAAAVVPLAHRIGRGPTRGTG